MPAITRIPAAGAMQGNETAWRPFVNVVALDTFKIDRPRQVLDRRPPVPRSRRPGAPQESVQARGA